MDFKSSHSSNTSVSLCGEKQDYQVDILFLAEGPLVTIKHKKETSRILKISPLLACDILEKVTPYVTIQHNIFPKKNKLRCHLNNK